MSLETVVVARMGINEVALVRGGKVAEEIARGGEEALGPEAVVAARGGGLQK